MKTSTIFQLEIHVHLASQTHYLLLFVQTWLLDALYWSYYVKKLSTFLSCSRVLRRMLYIHPSNPSLFGMDQESHKVIHILYRGSVASQSIL